MFDADGTNIKEVLKGFINDLVCGSQRHGSDEYAEQFTRRNKPVPESFEEVLENVRFS